MYIIVDYFWISASVDQFVFPKLNSRTLWGYQRNKKHLTSHVKFLHITIHVPENPGRSWRGSLLIMLN